MSSPRFGRRGAVTWVVAAAAALTAGTLDAQAWVAPHKEGTVALLYQHTKVRDHVFSDGQSLDVGHILTQAMSLDFDYGVTDRLSLSASVPFVTARYRGPVPHVHPGGATVDDGRYHGGLQDFHLDARYGALDLPVAITPFVAITLPMRSYESFGHASIGVDLREAQAGVNFGAIRSTLYVQGRYAYGVSERVIGRRRTRSNLDAELGWFATPRVRVFAFGLGQLTHDGLEIRTGLRGLTTEELPHHDRLARANLIDIGAGLALAITSSTEITASALTNVAGVNIHAAHYALTVGASWSFGAPPGHQAPLPSAR
jgi:hypothetical protein